MVPLSAKVYKHHKKADGTYNVKIYVYRNSVKAYIDTEHYVTEKKLTTDLQIKDQHLLSILNRTLDDYRQAISDLGPRIKLFDGQSLKDFLIKKNEAIDFLAFCNIHINQLKANGQEKSASNYNTVRNHLRDFFENDKFPIAEISTGTLDAFVRFLKKARQLKRFNQFKKEIIVNARPASDATVHNYLRDFSGLFSAAMLYIKPDVPRIIYLLKYKSGNQESLI